MQGPREFGRKFRRYGVRVERNASALVRKCALAVDTTVVLATPVDEGRARANWQVSIGQPADNVRAPYAAGSRGSTGAENAQAAIEQGKQVIDRHKPGDTVYITNNLDYIGKLNDGHSAQAPAGFVEKAIQTGVQAVRARASIISTDFEGE